MANMELATLHERVVVPEAPPSESPWLELKTRNSDGIDVALLWNKDNNSLKVSVVDKKEGLEFEIPDVDPGNPDDVYNHPYGCLGVGQVAVESAFDQAA